MPAVAQAVTIRDWQSAACDDAASATRELLHRLHHRLPPMQQRAAFAALPTEAQIRHSFALGNSVASPIGSAPYALKDLFYTEHLPLRAGSGFPEGILPQRNANGVLPNRLQSLGAVLAAKTHLHEFAYGLTGENAFHGNCAHPQFPDRTSGGSSSGSAVAVAAGIVPFAIGTDTGGSIRVPAAFCGLHGIRMQPMDTFIHDAFPLAHRFDTAGWLAATAEDLNTVSRALLGSTRPLARSPRGVSVTFADWGLDADSEVTTAVERASRALAPAAHPDILRTLRETFSGSTEAYAILQSTDAYTVHREWLDVRRSDYSPEVWSRIDRGRHWEGAQREQAHRKMEAVREFWTQLFADLDFVVLPATPFPALRHSECTLANRNRLLDLTTPASLAGLPVRTVPIGLPSGLTAGLQIVVPACSSPLLQESLG